MKSWSRRLMALLAGSQTRTHRCTDWRGRPRGEGGAGAIPPVRLAEADPYATLRLPPSPEARALDQ
jgi:hypothetical protein